MARTEGPSTLEVAEVLKYISRFKDHRGLTPFGSVNSEIASDRCAAFLSQAGCMVSFMSAAFEDSGELVGKGLGSEIDQRNPSIIAGVLDGVGGADRIFAPSCSTTAERQAATERRPDR